jgi:hypothetical protein
MVVRNVARSSAIRLAVSLLIPVATGRLTLTG